MKYYVMEIIGSGVTGDTFEDVERDEQSMVADAEVRMAHDSEIDGVEYTSMDDDGNAYMVRVYRDGSIEHESQTVGEDFGITEFYGARYRLTQEAFGSDNVAFDFEASCIDVFSGKECRAYWHCVEGFDFELAGTDFSDACDWEHADYVAEV